jgi:single-strand DNA-binding protein
MAGESIDATNVAVVQGVLSGAPRRRELPSGSEIVQLDVTTKGEAGSSSVPVSWFEPGALASSLQQGDAVVVVGHVHRRFFRSGGATQSRTDVVARRVVAATRKAQVARALAEVASALQAGDG